jgi:hypothetical protein
MNNKAILILLVVLAAMAVSCGKGGSADNPVATSVPKDPIMIELAFKKGGRVTATVRDNDPKEHLFQFDSEDKLPEFLMGYKERLEKYEGSLIDIKTEEPFSILKWNEYTDLARVVGAKRAALTYGDDLVTRDLTKPVPARQKQDGEKPNPLTLLVRIEDDGALTLNAEKQADLKELEHRLAGVFRDRATYKVFREGTTEVENRVYISVPAGTSPHDENLKEVSGTIVKAGGEIQGYVIRDKVKVVGK